MLRIPRAILVFASLSSAIPAQVPAPNPLTRTGATPLTLTRSSPAESLHARYTVGRDVLFHSGEFVLTRPLLSIDGVQAEDGPSMDVDIELTYRSHVGFNGPFGRKWDLNVAKRVVESGGTLTYYPGDGRADSFTGFDPGTQAWAVAPAGYLGAMVKDPSSSDARYTYTDEDGTALEFDHLGRLRSMRDRWSNSLTLAYQLAQRPYLPTRVTDTLGRQVDLAYTDGHLSSITDFGGRSVTFDYSTSFLLEAVHLPAPLDGTPGGTLTRDWTYAYAAGNLLQDVWTPTGELLVTNTYYAGGAMDGRVHTQTLPGLTFTLEYDTAGAAARQTGSDGLRRLWRNSLPGSPLATECVDFTGFFTPSDPDSAPSTQRLRPTDPASYTTSFEHDAQEMRTKTVFPRGNSRRYSFDALGNTVELRYKAVDAAPDDADADIVWTAAYDAAHWGVMTSATDPLGRTTQFFYDFHEAAAGDLNGDGITTGARGDLVREEHPDTTQADGTIQTAIFDQYQYAARGQLAAYVDPEGMRTEYRYHASTDLSNGSLEDFLSAVVVDAGPGRKNLTSLYEYDPYGNPTAEVDPAGERWEFLVNDRDLVYEIHPPVAGYTIRYEHDLCDRVTKEEVRNLVGDAVQPNEWLTTSYTHDAWGKPLTRTVERDASSSSTWTHTYTPRQLPHTITDPSGRSQRYEYDERGLPWKRFDADGQPEQVTTERSYDLNGNLVSLVDGRGKTWRYEYDAFDRRTHIYDPLGNFGQVGYDDLGRELERMQYEAAPPGGSPALLARSAFHVDELGRRIRVQRDPLDGGSLHEWQTYYDRAGNVMSERNARSQETHYGYDTAQRLETITDALSNLTGRTLDAAGNVTREEVHEVEGVQASMYAIEYRYDALGRETERWYENSGGVPTPPRLTTFDSRDNPRVIVGPEGNAETWDFDGLGLRTGVHVESTLNGIPATIDTSYVFDVAGRLKEYENELGHRTIYEYDEVGRIAEVRSSVVGAAKTLLQYDGNGNVIRIDEPNGNVVVSDYDDAGRLGARTYQLTAATAGTTREHYEWDGLSRLELGETYEGPGGTNLTSSVARTYTGLGSIETETSWATGGLTRTVGFAYDEELALEVLTHPDGFSVSMIRDELERISQIGIAGVPLLYQGFGGPSRLDHRQYFNGVTSDIAFDGIGRLEHAVYRGPSGTALFERTYSYTDSGGGGCSCRDQIAWIRDDSSGLYDVYTYDAADRLTQARLSATSPSGAGAGRAIDYTYADAIGNRETRVDDGVPTHYCQGESQTYRRVSGSAGCGQSTNLFYDQRGSLTHDGRTAVHRDYYYDARGQLAQVDLGGSPRLLQHFDALGRRVLREDPTTGERTRFVYAGARVIEERTGPTEALSSVHVYAEQGVDDRIASAHWPTPGSGTAVLIAPITDHLGTVHALTDAAGAVVERYQYAPFGQPSIFDAAGNPLSASGYGNRALFTGREWLPDLELYDYRARFYDPDLGRFLQRDPAGYDDSQNPYEYARSNPVNLIDPMGAATVFPSVEVKSTGYCSAKVIKHVWIDEDASKKNKCSKAQIAAAKKNFEKGFEAWKELSCPCDDGKGGASSKECKASLELKIHSKKPKGSKAVGQPATVTFHCDKKLTTGGRETDGVTGTTKSDLHVDGSENLHAHEHGHGLGLPDDYEEDPKSKTTKPKDGHTGHLMAEVQPGGGQKPDPHEACDAIKANKMCDPDKCCPSDKFHSGSPPAPGTGGSTGGKGGPSTGGPGGGPGGPTTGGGSGGGPSTGGGGSGPSSSGPWTGGGATPPGGPTTGGPSTGGPSSPGAPPPGSPATTPGPSGPVTPGGRGPTTGEPFPWDWWWFEVLFGEFHEEPCCVQTGPVEHLHDS